MTRLSAIVREQTLNAAVILAGLLALILSPRAVTFFWSKKDAVKVDTVVLMIQTLVVVVSAIFIYRQLVAVRKATAAEVTMRVLETWLHYQSTYVGALRRVVQIPSADARWAYIRTHPELYDVTLSIANFMEGVAVLATSGAVSYDTLNQIIGGFSRRCFAELHEPLSQIVGGRFEAWERFCIER